MIISGEFPNLFEGDTESKIEQEFAYQLCKILKPGVSFDSQIDFFTQIGNYRGDFILNYNSKKILVELDGKKFHNELYDQWRDAFILGEKNVDFIIRIKGKNIVYNIKECCYILMLIFPNFFSERSLINYQNQIDFDNSNKIRKVINEFKFDDLNELNFVLENYHFIESVDKKFNKYFSIDMHYKAYNKGYSNTLYNYALSNSIFNIDELVNIDYLTLMNSPLKKY